MRPYGILTLQLPVLVLIAADSIDEAVDLANASDYSLTAALWTSDLYLAKSISSRIRSGTSSYRSISNHPTDTNWRLRQYKWKYDWGRDRSRAQRARVRLSTISTAYCGIDCDVFHSGSSGYGRFSVDEFTDQRVVITHPLGASYPLLD